MASCVVLSSACVFQCLPSLEVNEREEASNTTEWVVFVGGRQDETSPSGRVIGFVGCLSDLRIGDFLFELAEMSQGLRGIKQHTFTRSFASLSIMSIDRPYIHTSTHPYIHTGTHPSIHTSTHPYIHTSTRSPSIHLLIHASAHPCIYSSLHPYIYSYIHSYIYSFLHPYIYSSTHLLIPPPFSSLFKTLISNPNHVLRSLCTLRPTIQYHLRPRPHPFNLPVSDNRNFLSRLMFLGTY